MVTAEYLNPNRNFYSIPANKVLKVDLTDILEQAELQTVVNRIGQDMSIKKREVSFAAVGIPWLQVGDCVRIIESSTTISEIYRITDLGIMQDNSGLTMTFSAYYYGNASM